MTKTTGTIRVAMPFEKWLKKQHEDFCKANGSNISFAAYTLLFMQTQSLTKRAPKNRSPYDFQLI